MRIEINGKDMCGKSTLAYVIAETIWHNNVENKGGGYFTLICERTMREYGFIYQIVSDKMMNFMLLNKKMPRNINYESHICLLKDSDLSKITPNDVVICDEIDVPEGIVAGDVIHIQNNPENITIIEPIYDIMNDLL
jgi:nucleoside-triphosphatase THEP1